MKFAVSARLCLGVPCRVDDADFACNLRGFRSLSPFSWLVVSSLRRRVGKQTPAAPELQLRDVVWSDESLFLLRQEPNRQITRICWVTVDLSFSQLSCHILLRVTALFIFHAVIFTGLPAFHGIFPVGFSTFLVHPRVCHRTWTGSRRTFEHVAAWVRRPEACEAAKGWFFRVAQTRQTASCRLKTQRKNTPALPERQHLGSSDPRMGPRAPF